MDERNKLNKQNFIILSICLSVVCAIIVSVAIVPGLGTAICGFIPVGLVSFCCAVGQIAGTIYYRNLLGGLYRENPVKSRNYEAVKSSKKWENVGNSYIIPADGVNFFL